MKFSRFPSFIADELCRKERSQLHYFKILKYSLRLRRIDDLWIAEYPVKNFFGFTRWSPLITYLGSDSAFPYKSKERAIDDIKSIISKEFENQICL